MKLTILSNNSRERVEPFARKLGLDFVARACKPLPFGMTRAQRLFGLPKKQIAVIGDQIFTDIVGGNWKGMYTILVEPFTLEQGVFFRLKRKLERYPIRRYQKQNGGKR